MKSASALLLGLWLAAPQCSLQAQATPPSPSPSRSIFLISTEFNDGAGFLIDSIGLVLTSSRVTRGQTDVLGQISEQEVYEGFAFFEDPIAEVALIRVHPEVVQGLPALPLSAQGYAELDLGDPLLLIGFPNLLGHVATSGVVSRKTSRVIVTDASVGQVGAGGPMLDASGRAVGVASPYLPRLGMGDGLGAGASAPFLLSRLRDARNLGANVAPPSADRLPFLPTDPFPLENLLRVEDATGWPTDVYNISSDQNEVTRRYDAQVFTPTLEHYLELVRGVGPSPKVFTDDLRYWHLDLGLYRPVVIARFTPRVTQSASAFWTNVVAGLALKAIGDFEYFEPIDDPRFRGTVANAVLLQDRSMVTSLRFRLQQVKVGSDVSAVAYLVFDPTPMCSESGRGSKWEILTVDHDTYMAYFPIPEATLAQICSDFRVD